MWSMIRDFVLGRCETEPPTAKQLAEEGEHLWRRPFEKEDILNGVGSLFYRVRFFFGFPPGWKLTLYTHGSVDPCPPHTHSGRLLSFIVKGGYWEERIDGGPDGKRRTVHRRPGRFNWLPNDTYHAIRALPEGRAVTVVLIFPTVQRAHYSDHGRSVEINDYWREKSRVAA